MTHLGYSYSRGLSRMSSDAIEILLDDVLAEADADRRRRLLMCPDILTAELELRLQFRLPDEDGDEYMLIDYAGQLRTIYQGEDLLEFLKLVGYLPELKARVAKVPFKRLIQDVNEWRDTA